MARNLTTGMLAEVTVDRLEPIVLIKLAFESGDLNLWTGLGDLAWNGDIYAGTGTLLALSPLQETQSLTAAGLTGTLSGIPSELISIALNENYMGRPVTVWLGAMTETGQLVSDPVRVFGGLIDVMAVEDSGETGTIQVTAENRLVRLEQPNLRRYTPEDQAIDYPGDLGLSFVAPLNDGRQIVWGRAE